MLAIVVCATNLANCIEDFTLASEGRGVYEWIHILPLSESVLLTTDANLPDYCHHNTLFSKWIACGERRGS